MSAKRKQLYTLLRVGHTHLCQTREGWDEECYRDLLQRNGATEKDRKISATTMQEADLEAALDEMKSLGFKPKARQSHARVRDRRVAKLNAMWIAMAQSGIVRNRSQQAMQKWCESQVPGVTRFEWMTSNQLNKAIEMMKCMADANGVEQTA